MGRGLFLVEKGISLPSKEKLWRPLTKDDMETIEETSYQILEEVGFFSELDEILKIAEGMGCDVNYKDKTIKFPENVIEEYVKKAPKKVVLAGRTSDNDITFEPGKRVFFMGGTATNKICRWDGNKNEYVYRDPTKDDLIYALKFMDSLECIDFLFDPPLLDSELTNAGLPEWIHAVRDTLVNCRKHAGRLTCNYSPKEWDYFARLAAEVVGGVEELEKRPVISAATDALSPGFIFKKAGWNMLGAIKYGIPCASSMGAVNPIGHPITLAGYLAVVWAGHLGHISLLQGGRPGIPCMLYIPAGSIRLKDGYYQHGPEDYLIRACRTQMAHELLGLPAIMGPELRGSSKVPNDIQTSYEQTLGCTLGTLCGSDAMLIEFSLEAGFNAEATVMGSEIIRYMKHMMARFKDLEPTPENLAYDAVKEVGPKGSLLTHEHTKKHMQLQYNPNFADYRPLNAWLKDKKTMFDRVREKVKEIEKYELSKLPADTIKKMNAIVKEADEELKRF